MKSTGSKHLDKYFNYGHYVHCIYGKSSTGKTNLCLTAVAEHAKNKRIIFIDTENSFCVERMHQLANKEIFNNIIRFKVKSIFEQSRLINKLEKIKQNISLIVVDSITYFYRSHVKRDPKFSNLMLAKQIKVLNSLAYKLKIPVLITSQVYSDLKNNIYPIAKSIIDKHCKCIIKLEQENKRKLIIEKHPEISLNPINFKINNNGIEES